MREAAVVLDDLLDGVVVGDADIEGRLDGKEGHALGARGCGQRARVLEDVGGVDGGEYAAEVNAVRDRGDSAGLLDRIKVRSEAGDDRVRGIRADLEHEGQDDNLGLVGWKYSLAL